MTRDPYLFADGEVEAEHVWVNEWTGLLDVQPAMVVVASASSGPHSDDAGETLADQLLLDIAEIERARDALACDVLARDVLACDEPAARAGGLSPLIFTVRSALAGLVKGAR
jgi:hypothetical protein